MNQQYGTLRLLRADLVRQRILLGIPPSSGLRLWGGIVAPRMFPVLLIRLAYLATSIKLKPLGKLISALNVTLFGIEVAVQSRIGPGLYLPHTRGTVLGAFEIGCNVSIYHGVTLGARGLDAAFERSHRPTIGNDIILGTGSVILGGVHIGNGATVGANAVVVSDVPAGYLAVGVPARLVKSDGPRNQPQ